MLLITCPVCGAVVGAAGDSPLGHVGWHDATGTLGDWTLAAASSSMRERAWAARAATDEAPTAKLPPITDTVRRRPPVPRTLDPGTPAMLRALAAAMEDDGLSADQLADLACYTCAHPASYHGGDGCDAWVSGEQARCGCVADPHGGAR